MKKFTIEFTWAVIFTLASLLWTVFERALGYHDEKIGSQMMFSMLFWLVSIPIYFFAIRDKQKNYYLGKANWTRLFLSGIVLSVFAALMCPLAVYISLNVVSPDFVENGTKYFVEVKKMTEDKALMYVGHRSLVIQGVSSIISVGVIISAIAALFIKSDVPEPIVEQPKTKKKKKR